MTVVWDCRREEVDPELADDIDATLGPEPDEWHMTSGRRETSEQATLWAEGREQQPDGTWVVVDETKVVTWAAPGHSPHEHGVGVDGQPKVNGALSWNYGLPQYARLGELVRAAPRMHWGGDFPGKERDPDHMEAYRWAHSVGGAPSMYAVLAHDNGWTTEDV